MTGLYNSDKTLKKGQVKDTLVTTLVDGYNGALVYSALSNQGHFLADAYDGYGQALTSTVIDAYANKRGLDVFVLNQNPVTVSSSNDTNYGTVGANTLRTASQIGNATGAADFNFGTVGAQTLRTAAEIGNATGLANFGAGTTGAQTLRTTSNLSDGYGIQLTSETTGDGYRAALDTWGIKGVPQHFNGTVGTTPVTLTPAFKTASLLIRNTSTSNKTLSASFNAGTDYFDVEKDGVLALEAEVNSFAIKGSTSGTTYQILVTHK